MHKLQLQESREVSTKVSKTDFKVGLQRMSLRRSYLPDKDRSFRQESFSCIEGVAAAWQYIPVNPNAELQLLVCEALKANRAGNAKAGWSGIGINYFNADWGFITGFERQISDKNNYTLPNEPGST